MAPTFINGFDTIQRQIDRHDDHFHNRERWAGISGDQSGNNWLTVGGLPPFQAISGDDDFGADANDEALLVGSDDTPIISGRVFFDLHRIFVEAVSEDTEYFLRVIWGTGTMDAAITALTFSETMFKFDSVNPQLSAAVPVDILFERQPVGTKVWAQAKNTTDNATITFHIGIHEYPF